MADRIRVRGVHADDRSPAAADPAAASEGPAPAIRATPTTPATRRTRREVRTCTYSPPTARLPARPPTPTSSSPATSSRHMHGCPQPWLSPGCTWLRTRRLVLIVSNDT